MRKTNKPAIIWNNCKHIGDVHKSPWTKYKVELVARDGVKYINIREWYMRKKDSKWFPSSKGVVIPIAIPIEGVVQEPLQAVLALIKTTLNEAKSFKIEDHENTVWSVPRNKDA